MKLDGRRESSNVDDRRGQTTKTVMKAGGLGIGGIVIVTLLSMLFGGDPTEMLNQLGGGIAYEQNYTPSAEEEELVTFTKQILAGTEDVWTKVFRQMGREYVSPKMVLYSGSVQTGGGVATSDCGPFYYSGDQALYIDLSFFTTMKKEIGADGDFAYAYVIAHEVGHHVQNLLGTLNQVHSRQQRLSEKESNQLSVRLELQADFYAGIWAYYDNQLFGSLEDGDIEEGLALAAKIGDDYLQKKAYGRTMPDTFNHGTSEQRSRWLKKGVRSGNMNDGDTFSPSYQNL